MRKPAVYLIFIVAVVGLGILSGFTNRPGEWYQSLEKPFFNPPPFVFAPVWTVLYAMIAIAGARIYLRDRRATAMQLWCGQMLLNLCWSPAFFGMQSPGLGLLVIVPLLALILAFIVAARRIDRPAALLFAPYAAWVGFATLLNTSILILN